MTQTVTRTVTETVPSINVEPAGGPTWAVVVGVAAITAVATICAALIPVFFASRRMAREIQERERTRLRDVLATMLNEVHKTLDAAARVKGAASRDDSTATRTRYWDAVAQCRTAQDPMTLTWARLGVLVGDAPLMDTVAAQQRSFSDFVDVANSMTRLDDEIRTQLADSFKKFGNASGVLMGAISDLSRVQLPELEGGREPPSGGS